MPPVAAGSVKAGIARLRPKCRESDEAVKDGARSSEIVPVPVAVPRVALTGPLSVTTTVLPSLAPAATATSRLLLVSPAAKVSVPAASAVYSVPGVAVPPVPSA